MNSCCQPSGVVCWHCGICCAVYNDCMAIGEAFQKFSILVQIWGFSLHRSWVECQQIALVAYGSEFANCMLHAVCKNTQDEYTRCSGFITVMATGHAYSHCYISLPSFQVAPFLIVEVHGSRADDGHDVHVNEQIIL